MILKETPQAAISYSADKSIGKIDWRGSCSSPEYRDTFTYLLEQQEKLGLIRYLSNIREQAVISIEDRKWFETVALPKAIEQGLKAAAVVFNGNVFKKYYFNVIMQSSRKFGLPIKLFNDVQSAEDWLMTNK